MVSSDPTAVIILSEIVAVETILIIGYVIFFILKKRKAAKFLKDTLDSHTNKIEGRKSFLKTTYSPISGINEGTLNTIVDDIVEKENTFIKFILETFHKGDEKALTKLTEDICILVTPYHQLTHQETPEEPEVEDKSIIPDVDSAIDELLADNDDDDDVIEDTKNQSTGDPALDLSGPTDSESTSTGETPDKTNDSSGDASSEMDEIPEELLLGLTEKTSTGDKPTDSAPNKTPDPSPAPDLDTSEPSKANDKKNDDTDLIDDSLGDLTPDLDTDIDTELNFDSAEVTESNETNTKSD
ncbi:MAG: hypothetical protein COB30_006715 [Ectothiorhodospiraceae bacterium]|nr:hypothetical protein [Ectothiorhodospiraceae bacterium]